MGAGRKSISAFGIVGTRVELFILGDVSRIPSGEAEVRNDRKSVTRTPERRRSSLTVELPEVEFVGGALCP